MKALTEKQNAVLQFIKGFAESKGYPPTRVEIARHFEFGSPNAAADHLKRLESKGAISIARGTSRGIKVLAA